jgi:hypothetical protein
MLENMEKLPLVYGPFRGESFYRIISFRAGTIAVLLTGNRGLFTKQSKGIVLLQKVQTNFGTRSTSYSRGAGCFLLSVKLLQNEADHSLSSNIEFKNEWICNLALNDLYKKTFASLPSPLYKGNIYHRK